MKKGKHYLYRFVDHQIPNKPLGGRQKMENCALQISYYDFSLLSEMIREMWCQGRQDDLLMELHHKLDSAVVISVFNFPPDVITLNSRFCVEDIEMQQETTCQLVVKEDGDIGCLSVPILSQLGVALIGGVVGSHILLKYPGKYQQLRINKLLFQLEVEFNQYYMHMKSILN